jgi:hypothetical protein
LVYKIAVLNEKGVKNDYNCDLFMNYDYSNHSSEVYEEDDELTIIKYTRK